MGLSNFVRRIIKAMIARVRRVPDTVVVTIDLTGLEERLKGLAMSDSNSFQEAIRHEIDSITDEAADETISAIFAHLNSNLEEYRQFRQRFELRLRQHWVKALDIFDLVHILSEEFGSDLNESRRLRAATAEDLVFEALTGLHGRGCLTASEIGVLLRTGHATGANTRWRTLHELTLVALFIAQHGQGVAEQYLEHEAIELHRGAVQHQKYAEAFGEKPLDMDELDGLRRRCEELIAKYGQGYAQDYGWATTALGKKRVTLGDIAESIDMSRWAPYVRMASHGVHSGPHGAYFDLGLPAEVNAIPSGPSQFGLAEPGANTLMFLQLLTTALIVHGLEGEGDTEIDSSQRIVLLTQLKVLQRLAVKGASEFLSGFEDEQELTPVFGEPPRIWKPPDLGI
jgi:hypothetical protein